MSVTDGSLLVTVVTMKHATMSAPDAGRLFGFGKNKSYELARTGELFPGLPAYRVGRHLVVKTSDVEKVLGIDDISQVLDAQAV
jgi:hypothetical protein